MSRKKAPHTFKDNFWSTERVKKGLSIKEIAELIGRGESQTGMFFSGQAMPSDTVIKELCDLFSIPFNDGQLAFQHAHRNWKAEHENKTLKTSAKKRKTHTISTVEDVLESLYSVLSCSEFLVIYNAICGNADKTIDPFAILYNKVDYKTFNKIKEIVDSVKTGESDERLG